MKICDGYDILINQYIDGELDPQREVRLREHLEKCPACHEYYRQLCAVSDAMTEVDFPKELHGSIMEAVGRERDNRGRKVVRFRPPAVAAAAAVLVIGLVGIAGIRSGMIGPPKSEDAADSSLLTASVEGALPGDADEPEAPMYSDGSKEDVGQVRSYKLSTRMASWLSGGSGQDVAVYNRIGGEEEMESVSPTADGYDDGFLNSVVENMDRDRDDSYGFCMVACGALEKLPEELSAYAEGVMPGGVVILNVKNDPSVREEIDRSMSENGFEVFYDEDEVYFTVDADAETGLVIIELDEE